MADDLAGHERVAALLSGPLAWHTVEHVEEVASTHDLALERLRSGVQPGLIVVADRQTAGRGRQGRTWLDGPDPHASLMLTATVSTPPVHPTLVPLAAGLATADALRRAGVTPLLKWPNDVLIDGRKAAGILVEQHRLRVGDVLLIGIGINVDWRGTERDGDQAAWTSIAEETGAEVDRGDLLADVLRGLAAWLHSVPGDPLRLLITYRDVCATIDAEVRVDFPDGSSIEGRAVDLDREGRLVVDTPQRQVAVGAGDVHHLRVTRGG
ncbi:biotin--[acetyl-CoA-carboxylase] ligase [Egicoccus sp. AB-alg6-2]|uniref:biotin--[acetyl-CoA-carboxylase] ligase n=1 Tax=Egicoccus sp. AB-alg6-2 TaxID=3242692 RepID=UPI00359D6F90